MRRKSTSSLGALHPVLFFMFIYGISLFLAIFVCRTVYFSINNDVADNTKTELKANMDYSASAGNVASLK
jgi:hypothetical protein